MRPPYAAPRPRSPTSVSTRAETVPPGGAVPPPVATTGGAGTGSGSRPTAHLGIADRLRAGSARRATAALATATAIACGTALAPAASAQAPPAPKPPHVLKTADSDYLSHLGPVRVNTRTSRLTGAYRAFGRPTSAKGKSNVRRVRWKAAGVEILGVTFGGCRRKTCRTSELLIQSARVTGPRWQTEDGLRVGEPAARIAELYPGKKAPSDGSGDVVLQDAYSQIGDPGDIPIVTALVRKGVVAGFDVWVGNAGD